MKKKLPQPTVVFVFFIFFIMAALIVMPACSKKKDKGRTASGRQIDQSLIPEIAEVKIDPAEPSSIHLIRAVPVLENRRMKGVKFVYKWFVNGDEVPREDKKLLPAKYYKKGDRVFCEVVGSRARYQSKPVESKKVEIANSKPVLNLVPVNHFEIPGRFSYSIQAKDPDGDTLTYRLIEPLDKGIAIDPETGAITWDIDQMPGDMGTGEESGSPEDESGEASQSPKKSQSAASDRLAPVVKIVFEVRDSDDAAVTASITLNLTQGSEIPQ